VAGDVICVVREIAHPLFSRQGDDLIYVSKHEAGEVIHYIYVYIYRLTRLLHWHSSIGLTGGVKTNLHWYSGMGSARYIDTPGWTLTPLIPYRGIYRCVYICIHLRIHISVYCFRVSPLFSRQSDGLIHVSKHEAGETIYSLNISLYLSAHTRVNPKASDQPGSSIPESQCRCTVGSSSWPYRDLYAWMPMSDEPGVCKYVYIYVYTYRYVFCICARLRTLCSRGSATT